MREIGARLDHLIIEAENPEGQARFLAGLLSMQASALPGGAWLAAGERRRGVYAPGHRNALACLALHFPSGPAALAAYRKRL